MPSPEARSGIKYVVGLGNQGMTYHRSRHNAGFMTIELLAKRHGVRLVNRLLAKDDNRPAAVYGDHEAGGVTIRLCMPLTMMNESGDALRVFEAPRGDVLIVCDDVNLPLGALRLRGDGGPGGHHGLESCLAALGSEQVPRLRLGVGAPDMPQDLTYFVLGNFRPEEQPVIREAIEQAADACELWAREGLAAAMNRYNTARTTG